MAGEPQKRAQNIVEQLVEPGRQRGDQVAVRLTVCAERSGRVADGPVERNRGVIHGMSQWDLGVGPLEPVVGQGQ